MDPSNDIQTTQLPIDIKLETPEQPTPPKPDKPKQSFKCLVCGKS